MRESHAQGVRVGVSEKKERRDSERKGKGVFIGGAEI